MPQPSHPAKVKQHPGSSLQDIEDEPEWGFGHEQRVGFRNAEDRLPGLTHSGDEHWEDPDANKATEAEKATEKYLKFREEVDGGKLVNFRDIINAQDDFHLRRPDVHSDGWRFVLNARENWIKNEQDWPANVGKKLQEGEAKKKEEEEEEKKQENGVVGENKSNDDKENQVQQEHEWKRKGGDDNKHHDAYACDGDTEAKDSSGDEGRKSEYEKLREKYSPQEIALLRSLQYEKDYTYNLKQNDGKKKSPVSHRKPFVSIDEADQFTPDNWIPRSTNLIRLTGKVYYSHVVLKSPSSTNNRSIL